MARLGARSGPSSIGLENGRVVSFIAGGASCQAGPPVKTPKIFPPLSLDATTNHSPRRRSPVSSCLPTSSKDSPDSIRSSLLHFKDSVLQEILIGYGAASESFSEGLPVSLDSKFLSGFVAWRKIVICKRTLIRRKVDFNFHRLANHAAVARLKMTIKPIQVHGLSVGLTFCPTSV